MRDLVVSAAIVAFLIGGWLIFDSYSDHKVGQMSDFIISDIIPQVEAENWEESRKMMTSLEESWRDYKSRALFFLNNEELSEIEYCMIKAEKYVHHFRVIRQGRARAWNTRFIFTIHWRNRGL